MSWLRRLPAFFVRCAESVPCPCCGSKLTVIGSRKRTLRTNSGGSTELRIRRLRCSNCSKIHHELPDCLVPYKRYESSCIEEVISSPSHTVAADESTLYRWRCWYLAMACYFAGCLESLRFRFHLDPVGPSSTPSQTAHQRIGRMVGTANGWLARVVRPIANLNVWVHTRFAFLSGQPLW
jgi:hypothetical protein